MGRAAGDTTARRVLDALDSLDRHALKTLATQASGEPILLHDTLNSVQRRLLQFDDFAPDADGR